ncbi:hypothetical protein OF829_15195 [Sphingomonas sp. LB-2]|uniref:hypothetical protein n=1 Tax=Sphingomonas caeni TaxID=2984949 RepID=UPI00222E67E5|nr:hypothetical protein [Sphingomonas caeni]MCW3848580.1 hypothetical protein [Sphingomonas caeni]
MQMIESSESAGSGALSYRAGVAVAVVTSLLTVWTSIVRDDGSGMGFFLVIMAAMVGGFAAWFRAAGMAWTMVGVAAMQTSLSIATATAPVVARVPDASFRALLFGGVFSALWLVSAALFHAASKRRAA